MWPNSHGMVLVLPDSRWSGAQADTETFYDKSSIFTGIEEMITIK